ncbi:phage head closure protein [Pseudomonas protegens]|uniref:phage head closure protein n=1 Tax=Pseudomonas protegens TaxID=380021 RepID=UPI00382721FC
MRAGKLRHRIDIQRPVVVRDPEDNTELAVRWETVWERCPASVEPLSAREFISAQAKQSEVTARIVVRYRPGLLPTMRIVHRGEIYNIAGALPDNDSGLEYLTLPVSRGVNDG